MSLLAPRLKVPSESLSSDFRRFQKRIVKDIEGSIQALTAALEDENTGIEHLSAICNTEASKLLHLRAVHADYRQREQKLIKKLESRLLHPVRDMDHEVAY